MHIDIDAIQDDLELFESRLRARPQELIGIDLNPDDGDVVESIRRIPDTDQVVFEAYRFDAADIGNGKIATRRWFAYVQFESVVESGWFSSLSKAANELQERTPDSVEVPADDSLQKPQNLPKPIAGMPTTGSMITPLAEDTSSGI
jgi:hypothetical protein